MIDVSLTVSPIKDTAGEVIGASTVARDVSEQRRAEDALKDAEERFRRAFDEAPIGMAIISADGRLEQANAALAAICGYTRGDLESMELRALLHPADIQTGIEALRALAAEDSEQVALDLRIIPAAGSARRRLRPRHTTAPRIRPLRAAALPVPRRHRPQAI